MGLLRNLTRIVEAPVQIVDKLIVEPLADVADMAAEGMGVRDDER